MGTIAEEITALRGRIGGAYDVIGQKGGTVPGDRTSWNLGAAIESIPNSKYGVTLDGMFGDLDANSILLPPTQPYAFESEDILGVADHALKRRFYGDQTLTRVSLPRMSSVGSQGMY